MKRIIALIFLAGFVSACSQYTCPTYAKKEAPKKESAEQKL
jgi:PBP1b-binding outer membrane lipoprotein LpoB